MHVAVAFGVAYFRIETAIARQRSPTASTLRHSKHSRRPCHHRPLRCEECNLVAVAIFHGCVLAEQAEGNVPAENDWLSASEAVRLNAMRFAKRRADWRLGRWTAKRAVAAYLDVPGHPQALANIEVHAAPSGAPEVFILNTAAPAAIS